MLVKVHMDFNKVFKKATAVVVGLGLMATQAAPAFALTQATDGIYERVPMTGVRLSFVDFGRGSAGDAINSGSGADLTRFYTDIHLNDDTDRINLGEKLIYGNGKADTNGAESYEALMLEFGDAYNDGGVPNFAVIGKDSSNSNNIVYRVLAFDGTNVHSLTVDDKPSLNPNSLEDFYEDARTNAGSTQATEEAGGIADIEFGTELEFTTGTDTATGNEYIVVDWFASLAGGTTNQTAGDPDVLSYEFDEVYLYTFTPDDNEVAAMMDINLSSADQNMETPEVDEASVKAVMRGSRARIEWAPVMEEGVVGYEVEISGGEVDGGTTSTMDIGEEVSDFNGEAATAEGSVSWFTQNPLIFAVVEEDADYDINIYTVNAEGRKSEGFGTDLEVESERVEFTDNSHLPDVETDNTFYNYIEYLYKLAIIDGYSDGEYKADDTVTRGQLAKFVVNAFQIPVMMGGESFPDVDTDNTFYVHIQTLRNAGIVRGFSDGEFKSDNEVTRGEATTYIVNAANFYFSDNVSSAADCFDDVKGNTHEDNICALAEFNDDEVEAIIGGYSDGNFGPEDPLTRGQMAKIILNAAASVPVSEAGDVDGAEVSFINYNHRFSNDADGILYAGSNYKIDYLGEEKYFVRPFVAPVEVEGFDADATDTEVMLNWDDLSADDSSVSGYIVERRERDGSEDDWEQLDEVAAGGNPEVVNSIIADATATGFDDTDVDDDTRYEYRLAAFKYIPVFASDEDYANQAALEGDDDEERLNMIVGPWVFTSVKTNESN